ncbi:MAG: serine/threonine protein kinase, partial [Actinomycetota bacterium]|nr:serine/threonine protein kinase [Actinomycetota bacterium]
SVVKLLGGGLRYEAYLAWEERLRSLVVVKVLRPGLVDDRGALAGLRREMKLLEQLNHPVVVRAFDAQLDGPRPHIVLEHLEGPRLSSLRRKYGPLLPEQLTSLGIEICAAVHYLSSRDLVHLDIKPSNIIMGGPPRLIDLSVARTVPECARLASPVGTDAYMAPEQAQPGSTTPIGPPADVWGLGASLYEGLTGQRPFPKGDRRSGVPAVRFPQLTSAPRALPPNVPRALADPIMASLAHDPAGRPTPAELGDRLQGTLDRLPKPRLANLKPRIRR